MKVIGLSLLFAALSVLLAPCAAAGDPLDEALQKTGLARADLGWKPKGWWTRYPGDIPYRLRHFDDLFSEPLATISFTRTMGNTARILLSAEELGKPAEKSDGALFRAVHALGVDKKFGGFRAYSANLTAVNTPLDQAILEIYRAAGRPTRFVTFGQGSPYPLVEKDLAEAVKAIPENARPILGRLVMNLLDAHHWATLAFRNVPLEKREAVCRRLDVGMEEVDALDYAPEFDDVARSLDEASLWYAGLKCVEMLDEARVELKKLGDVGGFRFAWKTPLGWIRISGTGDDVYDGEDALLIVDFGGDDRYRGGVAASNAGRPIGLLLDLGGDDVYDSPVPAQGAGLCGVGILLDVEGDDRYRAVEYAQGVGQFGLGACIDLAGDDRYFVRYSGEGCGYFGVGVLLDAAGDDRYVLHSDGQGFGGVAGVGVLADRSGDDVYEAVREATVTGRPSYHSELKISVSNAQGCAMGRRGDGADGHSWAGGLGTLIDVEGNDSYTAGNWSLGTGYWFGTGLVYEGGGDDTYRGVFWSQGSGAHFCIGALVDEGGDDRHLMEETSTGGLAFGHDFTVALLVDAGGDDLYEVKNDGLGFSINRSVAMLLDLGGNDTYRYKEGNRPGMARYDEKMKDRSGLSTYFADTTSLGLFLDVGGHDTYSPERANNTVWTDPPDSPNLEVRNFSIGWDCPEGTVSLDPIPEKRPSLR
jgi:hypothetical protein